MTVFFLAHPRSEFLTASTDVLFVLVSGAVSLIAFAVVLKWKAKGTLGRVHLGLFLMIFLWFLGELTWMIYEVILNVPIAYPSIADVFYLSAYFPGIIGIAAFIISFSPAITRGRLLSAILVGTAVVGTTMIVLIQPILTNPTDSVTLAFDLAYPILDSILLILAVLMIALLGWRMLGKPWYFIAQGIVFSTLADIAFSQGTLTGWYYSGHPVELLWLYGYLFFAYGFNMQSKTLHDRNSY